MYANKNYEILLQKYPQLYKKIMSIKNEEFDKYQLIISKNGYPTIKIKNKNSTNFLHSKYDPINEAKQIVDEYYCEDINTYVVYGFGLGYHIEELSKKNRNINIFVYETNIFIFKLALDNCDLSNILIKSNVHVILEDDIIAFSQQFNKTMDIVDRKFIVHMPSLSAVPQSLVDIKYLLEGFKVEENTIERYRETLDYNFNQNITRYNCCISSLFNKFNEVPIVIIAAGPSLQKNIKLLANVKNKAILIAVGTAVKPLLKEGVEPDLIIITDPHDIVVNQLENVSIDVPIIALSTVNHKVLKNYKGIKFIAMQKGYPLAERYLYYDNQRLVNTGGSVATTALDICLKLGCNPVIFVGQDLAFTNGESHIKGTCFYDKILDTSNLRPIKSQDDGVVYTSKNLYQYLKWIEKRIEKEDNKLFINATEGGAFIEGTIQMTLNTVISKYLLDKVINFKYQIQDILKKI